MTLQQLPAFCQSYDTLGAAHVTSPPLAPRGLQ